MKKHSVGKQKNNLIDKVLLILSAVVLLILSIIYLSCLKKFKIQKEWIDFISMSILYAFIFIFVINKTLGLKKRITNLISLLIFIFFIIFPIFVGYLLFYYKILSFPKRVFFIYFPVLTILLSISALLFSRSLKIIERKKMNKVTK